MDKQFLQTLKGFRDFLPDEARKRQFLVNKFMDVFELFGFEPLITPTLEYQELLLGKYGDEADKLVFKFEDEGGRKVALRYDQTVPTARIIAAYQENLPMPWRRYQIQNSFRAESPQKGRYREFTQCDIDIFGTTSPLSDAELLSVGNHFLKEAGFKNYTILINDRAIIFKILSAAKVPESMQLSVIQTLDKLDKIGREGIEQELVNKGVSVDTLHTLFDELDSITPTENLQLTMEYAEYLGVEEGKIRFTPRLARGLDYYNSTIYEFIINDYKAGSVAGGGRYDHLIERLCGVSIAATGFSWGFDRVIEAMDQFGLFPENWAIQSVLVSVFDNDLIKESSAVASNLRENGIACELFPDETRNLKKQIRYADKKGLKWLVVIGPEEVRKNSVILKDLETGHQEETKLEQLVKKLKKYVASRI